MIAQALVAPRIRGMWVWRLALLIVSAVIETARPGARASRPAFRDRDGGGLRVLVAAVAFFLLVVAAVAAIAVGVPARAGETPPDPAPIKDWWGRSIVPDFEGDPAGAQPVAGDPVPQHPHMAPNTGANTMHGDAYQSGSHPAAGPLGYDLVVRSHARGAIAGQCSATTFDSEGRIWSVCATFQNFKLVVFDAANLGRITEMTLAQRPSTIEFFFTFDIQAIMTDTSGGAYFYLDDQNRAVLADADQVIQRIRLDTAGAEPELVVDDAWDVADLMPRDCWSLQPLNLFPGGICDAITTVMPDWDGNLWWVTRFGRVGVTDPGTGATEVIELAGEEIQNAFAVAEDGVYIVSDHAMYGFTVGAAGEPTIVWREEYDRGTGGGVINQGSGTTPSLLGDEYVAITDNADGRVNALVLRRRQDVSAHGGDRLVCSEPLFEKGRSLTDNSLIAYGNSIIAENNFGHENFLSLLFGQAPAARGVQRIDVAADGSGCETVWTSDEASPSTVPKLSVGAGLVYVYTKQAQPLFIDAWYMTAIDFHTGETKWRKLTGTGWNWDNNWSPISIGPDGALYAGVFNGLIQLRDG